MRYHSLGRSDVVVSAMGLGCMGMTGTYGLRDADSCRATLEEALYQGINFFDTADIYGDGENEEFLAEFVSRNRQRVVIGTKFGLLSANGKITGQSGKPEYVRRAWEASASRLNVEMIDIYYLHREDPDVPIEDTVGAMSRLVEEGLVRCIGLSEVSGETLLRAAAVHPIAAVQSEYSLWARDVEDETTPACRESGSALVAFSPLSRSFLTGALTDASQLSESDARRRLPRFSADNFGKNAALACELGAFAERKGCTPAQLALAWLFHKGDDVVPIPGTTNVERLRENTAATEIELSEDELASLERLMAPVSGPRFPGGSRVKAAFATDD